MKRITSILAVLILLAAGGQAQQDETLPTLRGDEAIKQLKQSGQYDSLAEAVKAARKQNGQAEEPFVEDAVGQSAMLLASDGAAFDNFGLSVVISGNNIIVGANLDQGSAYAFRTLSGSWTQEAKKVASDGAANDELGFSVAISGDTAIVSADRDDVGANTDQGSAYVFVRSGTTWTQQQKLIASDGVAEDFFGYSVAISGDTAIVGAYLDDVGASSNQGSAYIFVRSGTTWSEQQKLIASDGAAFDLFGRSVAISGDTAIVGADRDAVGANAGQGSAYVFVRSGISWSQQQKLTAADGAANDNFGINVAISGETAIIGAWQDDVGANGDQGSAYIFVRSGTTWSEQQKLIAEDGARGAVFGNSVAISGDTAVVGAALDDAGANQDQGAAYIFVRSGTTWTQQQKLIASDGTASDVFGASVAISGETAVVGANGDDVGANGNQGSAYVFERTGATWTQNIKLVDSAAGAAGDRFGRSVAISGDKIVVGAFLSDASASTPLAAADAVYDTDAAASPAATDQGAAIFFINSLTDPGLEADTASRPNGDGFVQSNDVVQIRRFLNGSDTPDPTTNEFQRADSAPYSTRGEGAILSDDVVQARRYLNGSSASQPAGGPNAPAGGQLVFNGMESAVVAPEGTTRQFRVENATGGAGQSVSVNISIDAVGDESEYGFIINYDAKKLSFPVIGAGNSGAGVHSCNTARAGIVNCSVGGFANDPNKSGIGEINSGSNQTLITVQFQIAADARAGTTDLTFSNVNASNNAAQRLTISGQNGTVTTLAPVVASVTVSGRALTIDGRGIGKARVLLTDSIGETRVALTNSFGYFRFDGIEGGGQTITLTVISKRYQFAPKVVQVTEALTDLNFIGEP